jgi:hypothetical protein
LTLCANVGEEALMILHVDEIEAKLKSQPYLSLSEIKKNVSAEASGFYWTGSIPISPSKASKLQLPPQTLRMSTSWLL